jgi:hypothetical protein
MHHVDVCVSDWETSCGHAEIAVFGVLYLHGRYGWRVGGIFNAIHPASSRWIGDQSSCTGSPGKMTHLYRTVPCCLASEKDQLPRPELEDAAVPKQSKAKCSD